MSARLPPFSSLLALDALARHGTLTRAAIELNVSQPSLSRRIATLEASIGRPLLDRRTKPMKLNADGARLYEAVRAMLGRFEAVVDELRSPSERPLLSITAGSGLTAYCLIPNLAQLEAAFPEFRLRIVSRPHEDEWDPGDVDVRFGDGRWHGRTCLKLWNEEVFPVCSPALAGKRRGNWSAAQLASTQLLDMKQRDGRWFSWASWFEAAGMPRPGQLRVTQLESYPLVVDAAVAGQGMCLGWSGLVDPLLKAGVLVRVTTQSARSDRGYFVMHDAKLPRDAPARALARWMWQHLGSSA